MRSGESDNGPAQPANAMRSRAAVVQRQLAALAMGSERMTAQRQLSANIGQGPRMLSQRVPANAAVIQRAVAPGLAPGTQVIVDAEDPFETTIVREDATGYFVDYGPVFGEKHYTFAEIMPVGGHAAAHPVVAPRPLYTMALVQAAMGGAFHATVGGTQQSSADVALNGVIKYHVSILVADPKKVHVSFYPGADHAYAQKIMHVGYEWNDAHRRFGAASVIKGIWKPYAGDYSAMTEQAATTSATLGAAIAHQL